ncbi:MAG TPA: hypothetical protein VFA36_02080 [Burkholderiales bacterium]|jgi:hypothetical protein|nr:hypothetical protein [Burkholderiales bacterium]
MEATSGRSRTRLIVVDFLATLFVTFCIGISTALVLAACVMLMTGEAHGAGEPCKPAPAQSAPSATAELVLAHTLAAKYAGLVAIDRFAATADEVQPRAPGPQATEAERGCKS